MSGTWRVAQASAMRCASSALSASGFSHRTAFPAAARLFGPLGMKAVGKGDVDGIDMAIGEQLVIGADTSRRGRSRPGCSGRSACGWPQRRQAVPRPLDGWHDRIAGQSMRAHTPHRSLSACSPPVVLRPYSRASLLNDYVDRDYRLVRRCQTSIGATGMGGRQRMAGHASTACRSRDTIRDVAARAGFRWQRSRMSSTICASCSPGDQGAGSGGDTELRYSRHGIARSLRRSKTGTIGVIISDITNPFFADLVRGIENAIQMIDLAAQHHPVEQRRGCQKERLLYRHSDGEAR